MEEQLSDYKETIDAASSSPCSASHEPLVLIGSPTRETDSRVVDCVHNDLGDSVYPSTLEERRPQVREERKSTKGIVGKISKYFPTGQHSTGQNTHSDNGLSQKICMLEATVATQKKEILLLQRQIQSKSDGAAERRLESARQEIASLKEKLNNSTEGTNGSQVAASMQMHAAIERLSAEKNELLSCLRKQNKLIDALQRQKIHLESIMLIHLAEKEIEKYFELTH
uniref:Uncharacterized protein TCIL3000_11_12660 n=1 Tax=Trypanosoma congolense (strain IL3000) TaxID=1068625 RepID=G0V298_TRYCI|nr:unnamed protein product [Trypanosoma congolense IL3000]